MPLYTFENKRSGKQHTDMMTIAEMEEYLAKNKNIKQVITAINIVGGVQGISYGSDQGWKENMSRIAEAHTTSQLAQRYGKKSIKQIKTEQALIKNKKRIADRKKG